LLAANDAKDDTAIIPGDVLCLPPGAAVPATTTAATGPNCERSGRTTYSVVADDSWYGIAVRANVTLGSVLDANGATASSPLRIGDVLCLPKQAKTTTTRAATTSTPPTTTRAAGMTALPAHGPCYFIDSWHAPRGNGRRHEGVDLLTSAGRYVYAVADGVLSSRAWDRPGRRAGNAWWLTGNEGTSYFYAHLSAFAPGLKQGSRVKAGQVIGFVGATGNAAGPHLHFEIHPNGGSPINPYPAVSAMGGCKLGDAYPQPG
jgi:LysM repeat protein